MARESFDVLIIGAGQAGVPLAHALVARGRRVALAERARFGGSCVNFGCTPTKAALASTQLAHQARQAEALGVRIPTVEMDFAAVLARAHAVAETSRQGLEGRLERSKVRLLRDHARLTGREGDRFVARVGGVEIDAAQIVLDTGTRTRLPPIEGIESAGFIHAGNWLDPGERPEHVIVLGAGIIALEMGQFYRRCGSRVTLVERSPRIARQEDEDIAAAIHRVLEAEGVEIRTGVRVASVSRDGAGVHLALADGGAIHGSHLFVATGRRPNTDDLGLETVGVEVGEDGIVAVDERLATRVPGVWAAGDIRGGPAFTHTSWDDHRILLSQMEGDGSRTTQRVVPYAIFVDPEVGRVGITEQQARAAGTPFEVLTYEMSRNGRAKETGETEGFIKVLVDPGSRHILGAAAIGAHAGELIHLYVVLMNANAPATVIRDSVHIHPTLAEAWQSAVASLV